MKTFLCLLIFITFPITANSVRASDIYLGLSNNEGNIINNIEYSSNKDLRSAENIHKKEIINCLSLNKSDRDECILRTKIKYDRILTEINSHKLSQFKAVYLNISKICEEE